MDRWEYLVLFPYTVRHQLAESFLVASDVELVIDVGVYKRPLNTGKWYVGLDPLGVTPGAVQKNLAEWWDANKDVVPDRFAVVFLGFALEGSKYEWLAATEVARRASTVIVEWADGYKHQFGQPDTLLAGKNVVFTARMTMPVLGSPGFPEYPNRSFMVGTK